MMLIKEPFLLLVCISDSKELLNLKLDWLFIFPLPTGFVIQVFEFLSNVIILLFKLLDHVLFWYYRVAFSLIHLVSNLVRAILPFLSTSLELIEVIIIKVHSNFRVFWLYFNYHPVFVNPKSLYFFQIICFLRQFYLIRIVKVNFKHFLAQSRVITFLVIV